MEDVAGEAFKSILPRTLRLVLKTDCFTILRQGLTSSSVSHTLSDQRVKPKISPAAGDVPAVEVAKRYQLVDVLTEPSKNG